MYNNSNSQTKKKTSGNQSSVKVLHILEALAHAGEPVRLMDLARITGMNTTTTLRFLASLEECGYVYQESGTQRYLLTLKLALLADSSSSQTRMKTILRSILEDLANHSGESACLAVEQNGEVHYLDVADGPTRILKATQRIGHHAPLHCTGVGKLHLLNYQADQLAELAKSGFEKLTEHTITTLPELIKELGLVRKNLWAIDNEECEYGLRCVAAPIMDDHNRVIAALSITGPTGRVTEEKLEEIKYALLEATKKAAKSLGYSGSSSDKV